MSDFWNDCETLCKIYISFIPHNNWKKQILPTTVLLYILRFFGLQ